MGKIKIMLDSVRDTNHTISAHVPSLSQVKSGVLSVENRLYPEILRRNGIAGSFNSVSAALSDIIKQTDNLTKAIELYVKIYEQNEQKLRDTEIETLLALSSIGREPTPNTGVFLEELSEADRTKIINNILNSVNTKKYNFAARYGLTSISLWAAGNFLGPVFDFRTYKESTSLLQLILSDDTLRLLGRDISSSKREFSEESYLLKYSNEKAGKTLYLGKLTNKVEDANKAGYEFEATDDSMKKKLRKKGLREDNKNSKVYDQRTGKVTDGKDQEVVSEKKATIMEKELSRTESVSILEGKLSGESKYANGSITAKVGNAEATGNISGGLYARDKDGKTYLSPGVSAKVGLSTSAIEVNAEGQLGSDMLGAYGKADVTLLAGEAAAGVSLGMVNGKFEASANAEAEIILAEVEGEAGLNILGGEVGVSAGVKVGIGAKADFGYSDGKLKCELGASLGLGVDIGFEADIGGMVDTVADGAKSAVSAVQKGAESAMDFIAKGWGNLFD